LSGNARWPPTAAKATGLPRGAVRDHLDRWLDNPMSRYCGTCHRLSVLGESDRGGLGLFDLGGHCARHLLRPPRPLIDHPANVSGSAGRESCVSCGLSWSGAANLSPSRARQACSMNSTMSAALTLSPTAWSCCCLWRLGSASPRSPTARTPELFRAASQPCGTPCETAAWPAGGPGGERRSWPRHHGQQRARRQPRCRPDPAIAVASRAFCRSTAAACAARRRSRSWLAASSQ